MPSGWIKPTRKEENEKKFLFVQHFVRSGREFFAKCTSEVKEEAEKFCKSYKQEKKKKFLRWSSKKKGEKNMQSALENLSFVIRKKIAQQCHNIALDFCIFLSLFAFAF